MAENRTTASKAGAKAPALPAVGSRIKVEALKSFCGIDAGHTWELTVTSAVIGYHGGARE